MADGPLGIARVARIHPDRIAVEDDFGTRLTYKELDRLVNRVIRAFQRLGIGPGGHVAVLTENRAETVLVHQAAYRGGFYFTPLNPRLRPAEVLYVLRDSTSAVLVVDVLHRQLADEANAEAGISIAEVGGSQPDDLLSIAAGESDDPVPYQFGSVMAYTSGTAGVPKGVIRDRVRPSPDQLAALFAFGLRLNMDPEHDRHLATAPLYHGGPLISVFHTMNLGGSVRVMRRFEPERTLQLIEEWQITSAYMVPTMYHRLLALPDGVRGRHDLASLRSVMHTGAPCPVETKDRMLDWFGPVMYECYAATEGYGTYTICTPEDARSHPGTVGRPPPGLISIRDGDGRELPAGEVGLVFARTLTGFAPFRYKDDPEKTALAYAGTADDAYTVGDMGYLDADGYLYLTDRASDMIISGSINIYPAESERVLHQHPAVADVGVIGLPDAEWGERVVAVVQATGLVTDPPALEAELIDFCRARIASYKCPRQVVFLDDLGRDPSGKLRKRHLRELVEPIVGARP
jgi:long-chain acyl-CoA synthetase